MSNSENIKLLQAMLVVLMKRIEDLEQKGGIASPSARLKKLQDEAEKLLRHWD